MLIINASLQIKVSKKDNYEHTGVYQRETEVTEIIKVEAE